MPNVQEMKEVHEVIRILFYKRKIIKIIREKIYLCSQISLNACVMDFHHEYETKNIGQINPDYLSEIHFRQVYRLTRETCLTFSLLR
jgi:hypothetical protein